MEEVIQISQPDTVFCFLQRKNMSTFLVELLIILINGFFPACTRCSLRRNSSAVEDHNRTIYEFSHN